MVVVFILLCQQLAIGHIVKLADSFPKSQILRKYTIYMYVQCRKIYDLCVRTLESDRKPSHWRCVLPCFVTIFRPCMYTVFILQCKKTHFQIVKKADTSVVIIILMAYSVTSTLILLPILSVDQHKSGTRKHDILVCDSI